MRVRDDECGNQFALKLASKDARQHLLDELAVLYRCRHPNVIDVYGFASDNDRCGLLLSLMDTSLKNWIGVHEMGPGICVMQLGAGRLACRSQISRQILHGLSYIHAMEIVHCDVKPHNIVLNCLESAVTRVCLSDFGISAAAGMSSPANSISTAPYGSHECFDRGQGRISVSSAIDMWAFGCLAYELWMTGCSKHLFENCFDGNALRFGWTLLVELRGLAERRCQRSLLKNHVLAAKYVLDTIVQPSRRASAKALLLCVPS